MKARTRTAFTTLVLLLAAAGAVAVAWRVERKGEAEQQRKEKEDRLFAFERDQVKEFLLQAKGGAVKVERSGSSWRITSPLQAEADRVTVDSLLDRVAAARRRSQAAAAGSPLGRYGLDPPRIKLTVTLLDGKTESLAVGDTNSFDASLFVQPTGGAVDVVGGDLRFAVDKGLFDLREKRVLPFEDADVARIEVKGPKGAYALERDGTRWKVTAPVADRADPATVERLLGALRALRATSFVDAPGPDRAYGLDAPRWTVRITGQGGATRTLAVAAPPPAPRKGAAAPPAQLHARVDGAGPVAAVAETALQPLEADALALRDKTVLDFERDRVAAIHLDGPGGAIELQRKATAPDAGPSDAWTLTAPRSAPARGWKVSTLLYALSGLQATRFADESGASGPARGLAPPSRVVTLLGADGRQLARLEIGKEEGEKVYVRSAASPRIYEVEKSRLRDLAASADDLEEKPETAAAKGG